MASLGQYHEDEDDMRLDLASVAVCALAALGKAFNITIAGPIRKAYCENQRLQGCTN